MKGYTNALTEILEFRKGKFGKASRHSMSYRQYLVVATTLHEIYNEYKVEFNRDGSVELIIPFVQNIVHVQDTAIAN